MLAAEVWHYWVAFPLVAGGLALLIALFVGYLKRVTLAKYPRR